MLDPREASGVAPAQDFVDAVPGKLSADTARMQRIMNVDIALNEKSQALFTHMTGLPALFASGNLASASSIPAPGWILCDNSLPGARISL
jgi:hypothetical protein